MVCDLIVWLIDQLGIHACTREHTHSFAPWTSVMTKWQFPYVNLCSGRSKGNWKRGYSPRCFFPVCFMRSSNNFVCTSSGNRMNDKFRQVLLRSAVCVRKMRLGFAKACAVIFVQSYTRSIYHFGPPISIFFISLSEKMSWLVGCSSSADEICFQSSGFLSNRRIA